MIYKLDVIDGVMDQAKLWRLPSITEVYGGNAVMPRTNVNSIFAETSLLNVPIDNGVGALSIGVRAKSGGRSPPIQANSRFPTNVTATLKKMQHAYRAYRRADGVMPLLIHCGYEVQFALKGMLSEALQDARARRLLPLSLSVARVASDIDEIEDGFASLVLDDGSTTIPNSLPAGSADNVDIPLRFVIQAALAIILYLLVDLQRKASRFSMIAACLKTESAHPARLV
ncbi:hypothetical protein DFJ58DRAFT_850532 [Suillus subalutaceus]|uniref:uncharacterized protein n=1 Tax=Suillus subalutaceus TaxID=48586 RepID=UPI001B87F34F|nr:uncharacterized protein DFJ58DRAFT_850532 [Suillus subalutaceus]KAG1815396.1 hypothetical protein DFJ58DRAFT_850532 [Suillus subalutaceus]